MTNIKPKSYLAGVAADRDERIKDLSLELAIPTWDKKLLWGFRLENRDWLEKKVGNGSGSRELETDIDALIEATQEFWFFDPAHAIEGRRLHPDQKTGKPRDEYVRVEDESGAPLRCDQALAEALDFTPTDERKSGLSPSTQLVLHLFKGNGAAIGAFVGRLVMWMQNTDLDVTKATLGE